MVPTKATGQGTRSLFGLARWKVNCSLILLCNRLIIAILFFPFPVRPDVWFVTNTQALLWITEPKTLKEMTNYAPWDCNDRVVPPKPCSLPTSCPLAFQSNNVTDTRYEPNWAINSSEIFTQKLKYSQVPDYVLPVPQGLSLVRRCQR